MPPSAQPAAQDMPTSSVPTRMHTDTMVVRLPQLMIRACAKTVSGGLRPPADL